MEHEKQTWGSKIYCIHAINHSKGMVKLLITYLGFEIESTKASDILCSKLIYVTLFGKSRLNENSVVAFFRCNLFLTRWKCIEEHFHGVLKRWQCFSMELKCVGNPFQNHFKTLSMHFQTLATHSMKRPAVWNHSQNRCYQSSKSLQWIVNNSSTYSIANLSVLIWAEISKTLSFLM